MQFGHFCLVDPPFAAHWLWGMGGHLAVEQRDAEVVVRALHQHEAGEAAALRQHRDAPLHHGRARHDADAVVGVALDAHVTAEVARRGTGRNADHPRPALGANDPNRGNSK